MRVIESKILVTREPVRDDAFCLLMDALPRKAEDIKFTFRFDELQMIWLMFKRGGMIRKSKTYIHYTFEWDEGLWFFNASGYFDNVCKKYGVYPGYMNL